MVDGNKYNFSFTASSLRLNEMILVAEQKVTNENIDLIDKLGNGKVATGKRMLKEFEMRLSTLSDSELKLFVEGDLTTQKQVAFLSVCKTYGFIRDFVLDVLREKVLVFDYEILEGDYISFYRQKFELHPEMEKLSELTEKKVKQVVFKILEQAGIIDSVKTKVIQPQILEANLINTIAMENKQWLKVFFMSDMDIENIN